jgi:hypothetical protein
MPDNNDENNIPVSERMVELFARSIPRTSAFARAARGNDEDIEVQDGYTSGSTYRSLRSSSRTFGNVAPEISIGYAEEEYNSTIEYAPSQIPLTKLLQKARGIALPATIKPNTRCAHCSCPYEEHFIAPLSYCMNCNFKCPNFVMQEQFDRIRFSSFLRWSKRWIKGRRGRNAKKLEKLWDQLNSNIAYLSYCSCKASTFTYNARSVVKRQDGLACSRCHKCASCCECVQCVRCHRWERITDVCPECKHCFEHGCCRCKKCKRCGVQCGFDFCQRCGICNTCCKCDDLEYMTYITPQKPTFHKPSIKDKKVNSSTRFIAAEIEVAILYGHGRPIYDVVKRWGAAAVRDGSLPEGGFEINTAPAGGDLYIQQVNEICNILKIQEARINAQCGLHIHVDARDLSYYDIRRLIRVYAAIEKALFAMVSAARKSSRFCYPCGDRYVAAIEEGKLPYEKVKTDVITSVYNNGSTQDLRTGKYHSSRYNALNLHSWFYRGTIECRMYDGTIDANDIIKYGMMWAHLIDYVIRSDDETITREMNNSSIKCLMKVYNGQKDIQNFIKNKIKWFGNSAQIKEITEWTE